MTRTALVFIIVLFYLSGFTQDCADLPSVTLSTQTQVDSFPINNPGVTDFYEIIINGIDITHLDSLYSVELCGVLDIKNTSIQDLTGLDNFTNGYCESETELGVFLEDNIYLVSLKGLQNLEIVSDLVLRNNPILRHTEDLDLKEFRFSSTYYGLGKEVIIENNQSLNLVTGFDSLRRATKLEIIDNPLITDLSTFNNLDTICNVDTQNEERGWLKIKGNPLVEDLETFKNIVVCSSITIDSMNGLSSLEDLEEIFTRELIVQNNANLETLDLKSLSSISSVLFNSYTLSIINNPLLRTIKIQDFNLFKTGDIPDNHLTITNNSQLKHCNEDYICNSLLGNHIINKVIKDNAPGCFNYDQIITQCSSIRENGIVYLDENCNQTQDNDESGVENLIIQDNYQQLLTTTRKDGFFGIPRNAHSGLDLNIEVRDYSGLVSVPDSHIYNFENQENLDFGLCVDSLVSDLRAEMIPLNNPTVNQKNGYKICVVNNGTFTNSGNLTLTLDNENSILNHIAILETDDALINQNEFQWDFMDLGISKKNCFELKLKLNSDPLFTDTLKWQLKVDNNSGQVDNTPSDNIFNLYQQIVNNKNIQKLVYPSRITEAQFLEQQEFIYTIQFQNNYDQAVQNLVIIDSIPIGLDVSTFEMISSSHDFYYSIADNVISWYLDSIDLPNDQQNQLLSQGEIRFKIKNKPDLTYIDSIQNRAYVYMDCYEPIASDYTSVRFQYDYEFKVSLSRYFIDCTKIRFRLKVENIGDELSPNTTLQFSLADTINLLSYDLQELDGGTLTGKLLEWEIDSLAPSSDKDFLITLNAERSSYDQLADIVATLEITANDAYQQNNIDDVTLGIFEPNSLQITSQTQLDNCSCLTQAGILFIRDTSLVDPILNVDSLLNLEKIEYLNIYNCELLEELNGLSKVIELGRLSIGNNSNLKSINGFTTLKQIDDLLIQGNPELWFIEGFLSLEIINAILINGNSQLENIVSFSPPLTSYPQYLEIANNPELNTCQSDLICSILENGNTDVNIENNDMGCNTREEVIDSCGTSWIADKILLDQFNIYPNPTKNKIYIEAPNALRGNTDIKLTGIDGTILHSSISSELDNWCLDITNHPSGIYFLSVATKEASITKKLVIGN